jgi:hypothetical protein
MPRVLPEAPCVGARRPEEDAPFQCAAATASEVSCTRHAVARCRSLLLARHGPRRHAPISAWRFVRPCNQNVRTHAAGKKTKCSPAGQLELVSVADSTKTSNGKKYLDIIMRDTESGKELALTGVTLEYIRKKTGLTARDIASCLETMRECATHAGSNVDEGEPPRFPSTCSDSRQTHAHFKRERGWAIAAEVARVDKRYTASSEHSAAASPVHTSPAGECEKPCAACTWLSSGGLASECAYTHCRYEFARRH